MSDLPLIAVKGRFQAPNERMYGLFLLILNQEAGFIDTAAIVVTAKPDILQLSLNESCKTFENKIQRTKYEGQYAQSITTDLQETLKSLSMDLEFYNDLMKNLRANDHAGIKHTMSTLINRVLHDNQTVIEIQTEEVTHADLATESIAEESSAPPTPVTDEGVILKVSLVIAPVGGKDVATLKKGDKIMVRIDPTSDKAQYFIDVLKLRTENGVKPTMGEIVKMETNGKTTEIKVKLDDNVYGQVYEEEKVLVRMFDANADPASSQAKGSMNKPSPSSSENKSPVKRKVTTTEKKSSFAFKIALGIAAVLILLVAFLLLAP